MRIAFRHPALIAFVDAPELRLFNTEFGTAYVLDNKQSFYNTKTQKLCFEKAESSNQYFWPIDQKTLIPLSMFWDDDSFLQAMKSRAETFELELETFRADLADPDAYVARVAAIRAERQRENEARDARRLAAQEEADRKAEERYQTAVQTFIEGGKVSWADFERMCVDMEITMHIRTIGSGRRHVSSISTTSCMISRGAKPDGIWPAIRALQQKMTEPALAA